MDVGEPPGGPRGRGRALGGAHPREQGVGPLAFIFGDDFSLFILRYSVKLKKSKKCLLCPGGPSATIFCYMKGFFLEKIVGKLTGRNSAATRRNLGGINLGLWRSCSAGETSLREGEIITNDPLIGRGSISINIFTSTISSQNPSSSLVSNLISKPLIGTCGLLVVLITHCS